MREILYKWITAYMDAMGFILYGGGKGSAPAAPDYRGAAEEQAASGKENLAQQTWANRPTLKTPWGGQSWDAKSAVDPSTGLPVTRWESEITLSPEQQAAQAAQARITAGRSGAAEGLLGQATKGFEREFNWGGAPKAGTLEGQGYDPQGARNRSEQALFQRQLNLIEPGLTQSEGARRTRLANMGITPEGGSESWNRAQTGMDSARNQAYQQAALAAIGGGGAEAGRELGLATGAADAQNRYRQQYIAEEAQKRGMSLNELNALLTGQQVNMPGMPNFNPAGKADATNYLGAAQSQGQYGLDAAKMKQEGALDIGSLVGTAAGAMMMSDRRLKRIVRRLGKYLCEFEYVWGGPVYVGVIAQEILPVWPEAVHVHPSGFLMVDYGSLQWQ